MLFLREHTPRCRDLGRYRIKGWVVSGEGWKLAGKNVYQVLLGLTN